MSRVIQTIFFYMLLFTLNAHAQITAQWRGPDRNGVFPETHLMKSWPEAGPEMLWSVAGIHSGFTSPAVTDRAIYVTGKKESVEVLTALNKKGAILWQKEYGKAARQSFPDARTTPTVEGDRIYVISGLGDIACLKTDGSGILWKVPGLERFQGKYGRWEVSESPLIVDDKLIYTPAGDQTTVVALDKMTGKTVWQSESLKDNSAYVSPILIERGGKKIVAGVTGGWIFGVDANSGEFLWKVDYAALQDAETKPAATDINCNSPIYHDGRLFVTSGYDHVGVMFTLSKDGLTLKTDWITPVLDTHHGHVVLVNGHIYGSNWLNNRDGHWVCLDWETGKVNYETPWQTKGAIISADGMLYCYDERKGHLALVPANPAEFEPVSEFQIKMGEGPHWGHPVIQGGVLYVRHGDVLMAFDIKEK